MLPKMLNRLVICLLYSVNLSINAQSTEMSLEKNYSTCFNETDCGVSESANELTPTMPPQIASEDINKSRNLSANLTVTSLRSTTPPSITTSTSKSTIIMPQNREGICGCDLTVSSCDINCCCDIDCKELNVREFFTCKDNRPKIYDARYCYESDYIQYNRSRYLLEKLRDNLFCIVADNLPPVYSVDYDPIISNITILEEIIANNKQSRFKWDQSTIPISAPFNSEKSYQYGDVVWKIQNSYIKRLEIPQTGFTGICSLKKSVKYLEDWKHSCMQINLENSNSQLFVESFNNFSIIASPVLYNDSNLTLFNQSCSGHICVPVKSQYCIDSWIICKNESTIEGRCWNGTCRDIVKGVKFVVTHSGIKGINDVEVYFKIGNASDKYYQEFQVEYKWQRDNESSIFHLSGNPGYIIGKPLIMGNLIQNKTSPGTDHSFISLNKDEYFLSLPIAKSNGHCNSDDRYAVNFGEDLKLGCKIEMETLNFTINSCVDIQKRIIDALLKNILYNVTEIDKHSIYIAKWNYIDKNDTDNWVKILFDRIPNNIVTGKIIDDMLMCSGLVTAMRIDVVYRHLSESQIIDNYKILGVAITFSEDSDIYWDKCETDNCTDTLSVDVISYVIFHDVSQPSKYYFAEGPPNLDISLPHDFFYPFINGASSNIIIKFYSVILCTCVALIGGIYLL